VGCFGLPYSSGGARNFVREGPVTDIIRLQSLAILHKDHFDVQLNFWSITTGYYMKYTVDRIQRGVSMDPDFITDLLRYSTFR